MMSAAGLRVGFVRRNSTMLFGTPTALGETAIVIVYQRGSALEWFMFMLPSARTKGTKSLPVETSPNITGRRAAGTQ
jgi:hypothetical protein